jgi:hypothetical protein
MRARCAQSGWDEPWARRAQKLAGGNVAIALLCNTIPTGAILVVLILIFAPISGAHFNPAVSIAFALQRELPWSMAAGYIAAQIIGPLWACGRPISCLNCRCGNSQSLRALAPGDGSRRRSRRSDCCSLSAAARHGAGRHSLRGRPLHHLGLLVHRIDIFRQSSRDNRALVVRHFRRDCSLRRGCIHRRAVRGNGSGRDSVKAPPLGRPSWPAAIDFPIHPREESTAAPSMR